MKHKDDQRHRVFKTIQLTLRFAHECSIGRWGNARSGLFRVYAPRGKIMWTESSACHCQVPVWKLVVIMKCSQVSGCYI